MVKFTASVILTTALTFVHEGATSKVFAKCAASNEGIYNNIASRVDNSGIAIISNLTCDQITQINNYQPNDMLITSGRKRGKYTICLSDTSTSPCKYIIGTFNENRNPSDMLSEVFGIAKPKQKHLNETVERLFFSPSLLID